MHHWMHLRGIALFALTLAPVGAQTARFGEGLFQVLEKAACRSCHNVDGVASVTRLQFPEPDATPQKIEAFGRSLVTLIDRERPENSLLLNKPTNRMPHAGGERIKRGAADEAALRDWISFLTRLLGDQTAPANQFPPEDFVNGFRNQFQAQSLSPLLIEAYSAAAEKLARNAFRGGGTRLIPCQPLTAEEQKRYASLFTSEKDFTAGAQLVVEAMLQSSHFLFRLDDTSNAKLRPYATASRLSYAIWDSMPDAALLEAAARGE